MRRSRTGALPRVPSLSGMRSLVVILCALCVWSPQGAEGFFPGKAMSGSEQLEAYIGFKCEEGVEECHHSVDLRRIYQHTNDGVLDHRLRLGPSPYMVLQIRTAYEQPYHVFIHTTAWSHSPEGALLHTLNGSATTNLNTLACAGELLAHPLLFISIVREGVGKGSFDFSFALKQSVVSTLEETNAVMPAQAMAVVSVPVYGIETLAPDAKYEVELRLSSIFPEGSTVGLRILGDGPVCAERVRGVAEEEEGWETSGVVRGVIEVGYLQTKILYIGVLGHAPKRQLLSMKATVRLLEGPARTEEALEEQYLRLVLVGDTHLARGHLYLAMQAFRSAQALLPGKVAAKARQMSTWLAASPQDQPPTDSGALWPRAEREEVLFGLVGGIGAAARELGAPAASGRASRIRTARDSLLGLLHRARIGSAELAAAAGDGEGASRIMDTELAELQHLELNHKQATWEAGALFKSLGKWKEAAKYLKELSELDQTAWIVHHTLAGMLANEGNLEEARQALERAITLEGETYTSLLLLAEVELKMGGCGGAQQVQQRVDQAITNGASAEGRAQALIALTYLCMGNMEAASAGFHEPEPCRELYKQCVALIGERGGKPDPEGLATCGKLPCAPPAPPAPQ